jgi:hypothetical protein
MKPLLGILQFLIGCHHRHKSGVFTIKQRTYQVCLQCGQEVEYSWVRMRSVRANIARGSDAPLKSAPLKSGRRPEEAVL